MSKRQGATYPNQREYRVYKSFKDGEQKLLVSKNDADKAFQILTRIEFYIWMDMMSNKENHTWGFSPASYAKRLGISDSSARKAFGAIVEKGFAEQIDSNGYKIKSHSSLPDYADIYVEEVAQKEDDKRWD